MNYYFTVDLASKVNNYTRPLVKRILQLTNDGRNAETCDKVFDYTDVKQLYSDYKHILQRTEEFKIFFENQ